MQHDASALLLIRPRVNKRAISLLTSEPTLRHIPTSLYSNTPAYHCSPPRPHRTAAPCPTDPLVSNTSFIAHADPTQRPPLRLLTSAYHTLSAAHLQLPVARLGGELFHFL